YGNSLLNVEAEIQVNRDGEGLVSSVVREFGFPYVNIANSNELFPTTYNFRGGIPDVTNAIGGLVPSRLINVDFFKTESISEFNTKLYSAAGGVMPVDIVSFGYMSFGLAGVAIIAFLFGLLVRWTENLFSYRGNLISCVFA